MLGNCAKLAQRAYRWLVRRPSYMLLTADTARLDSEPAPRFAHAWGGLILLGVISGVALVERVDDQGVQLPGVPIIFRDGTDPTKD